MIPYFPFSEKFDTKMGISPLIDPDQVMEVDEHYQFEVSLKRDLLKEDHHYYYQADSTTEQAPWEVIDKILPSLAKKYPQHFSLEKNGSSWTWQNKILNESQTFIFGDSTSLPLEPLDWVGRQVQEDLIILNRESLLVAGQLCFPSGWCLDDKIGKHFLDIHAPLPSLLNPMMQTANSFIERIPLQKTFVRNNWGFRIGNQLDLTPKHADAYHMLLIEGSKLTYDTIDQQVFLRVEHQTLSRLPYSGHILFTIHTYQSSLAEEAKDKMRMRTLFSFLSTVPQDVFDYKLMTPFAMTLIDYVRRKSEIN